MRRPALIVAVLLALGGAGTALAASGVLDPGGGCSSIDWARWRQPDSAKGDYPSPRQRIASKAIDCEALIGRRRSVVRRLLGKPDIGNRTAKRQQWLIGVPAIPIDAQTFALRYDGDRVIEATVETG